MGVRGRSRRWDGQTVYTVGHSTRSVEVLIDVLRAFGVVVLADIRTMPRSRRNPQFNSEVLAASLAAAEIAYAHIAELGGLRRTRSDSINTGWRNASFRGYADHMGTPTFETGLAKLRALALRGPVAIMCAEAVPWRCHRNLVADVLTARGAHVEHIASATSASRHRLTPFAHVNGAQVTYPGPATAVEL